MSVLRGHAVPLIAIALFAVFAVLAVDTVAFELSPSVSAQAQDSPVIVPVPAVTGPIPVTEDSHPFAAASIAQTAIDLSAIGFVEEEFFISGSGNVYDWEPDGGLSVRTGGLEYTTRILVRRPVEGSNFSGTVLVDVANQGAGFDTYAIWGQLNQHLLLKRHAWVAVTVFARNIGALKMFDMGRYGNLAYPSPVEECGRVRPDSWNRPAEFFPRSEEGIRWDVISQVGALLRSDARSNPLGDFEIERVYAGMQSGGDLPTYANAIHRNVRLSNGEPVYDGYLIKESGGPRSLNACAEPLEDGDPRRVIRTPVRLSFRSSPRAVLVRPYADPTAILRATAFASTRSLARAISMNGNTATILQLKTSGPWASRRFRLNGYSRPSASPTGGSTAFPSPIFLPARLPTWIDGFVRAFRLRERSSWRCRTAISYSTSSVMRLAACGHRGWTCRRRPSFRPGLGEAPHSAAATTATGLPSPGRNWKPCTEVLANTPSAFWRPWIGWWKSDGSRPKTATKFGRSWAVQMRWGIEEIRQ